MNKYKKIRFWYIFIFYNTSVMQLQEHKKIYVSDDKIFSFQDSLLDNISFKVFVQCSKEKFLQYQKDIFEEFVADFTNTIKTSESLDILDIREIFEHSLQLLNTKLKQFAEKVRDVEHFQIKWIIQLVVDDKLMSSMIGNVSMMVMRDQKTAYSLSNSIDTRSKIDLCSDFIEWNIERDDQILYVWLKFADIMDSHDIKEMESLLAQEDSSEGILSFIEELFLTRVEKNSIWFIISYFVQGPTIKLSWANRWWLKLKSGIKWKSTKYISDLWNKVQNSEVLQHIKTQFLENKIYFIGSILLILMVVFVSSLLSQIVNDKNHTNKFQTSSWAYKEIDLNKLQNEIAEFKTLDASSDYKTKTYKEISDELNFLEAEWKWLEDVSILRSQLEENFNDWFNVRLFDTDTKLNNIAWRNTQVFSFNSSDISKLWSLRSISVPNGNIMIWWSKWAIIGASSDTNRWVLQPYNLTNDLDECIASLNSNWIYCYNNAWEIYLVSKTGILPVWTEDWDFRSGVGWLWTYNNRNLYVFNSNVSSLGNMLLSRYQTNSDWTYANFKKWSSYSIAASGVNFGTFSSFAIDGNFFGWADGKLYLFWREDVAWTTLEYRQINIKWWNPYTDNYSNNVKIITSNTTRYIYIFDKDQQLLTVYNTEKTKMNEENKRGYQLVYMFSLKFAIEWVDVYDADIPSSSADRPELYLLTSQWVNKIALYEFIETMK